MRDLPALGERQPCEERSRLRPVTQTGVGYNFSGAPFAQDPSETFGTTSSVDEFVPSPNGHVPVTIKIPGVISSRAAIIAKPGFLGRGEHYTQLCEELASGGIVAATSHRMSPESTSKLMQLITKETGCTVFHIYGHSHGGSDAVEDIEYLDGENVQTLTLAGSRSLGDHGSLQMLARSIQSFRHSPGLLPVIGGSLGRNPLNFAERSIRYADYLARNLPRHIHHGLGEVATLNVADRLGAIHESGKVAIGGMYFANDTFVTQHEARAFENLGHFDAFAMHPNPRANHFWPVSHPGEVAREYTGGLLAKLRPVYTQPPAESALAA